jgi:hypothetical protein
MNSGLGSVRAYAMSVRAYMCRTSCETERLSQRHLCVCTACTPLFKMEVLGTKVGTKGRRTVILNTKNVAANCVGLGMMVSMTCSMGWQEDGKASCQARARDHMLFLWTR